MQLVTPYKKKSDGNFDTCQILMSDSYRVQKQLEKLDQQFKLLPIIQKRQEDLSKTTDLLARRLSEVLDRCSEMMAKQTERAEDLVQEVDRVKRQSTKNETRVGDFMRQLRDQQDIIDRFKEKISGLIEGLQKKVEEAREDLSLVALNQSEIHGIKTKIDNSLGKFDLKLEQYRIALDERLACIDLGHLDSNLVERDTLEREKSEIFQVMRDRCALIESKVREV